ncbi:Gfo/Idh/MocA family protein [Leucobacter chromiiresistens]|uniref:Oxidoreductase n=1 Tax=Leucobacter chromiiresistens TaxID=1079994 RepID=A0A147EQW5_9MICO|nr:Gfo/Idh/MocA family oxidoreductase [Leucobacter chromiiresistens]KTR86955.1 oxidoreductase [Leucobacter chromiiresistens]
MSPQTMESRRPSSIGMLGAGFMARTHTHAARLAGARLATLAASSPQSSERAAAALGYERAATVEQLLAEEHAVVHVCTPNTSHVAFARAALLAGSHVICEKPLATSAADARALVELVEAQGLVGAVPFVYRYHPMVREARARIAGGGPGAVVTISGQYLQDWLLGAQDDNWRVAADAGGPSRAFADIGSHLVDLVEFVSGDRITRLVATTRTVHAERNGQRVSTEDAVALTLELAGGGIGSLLVSQVAPGRKNGLVLEIAAADESVRFEQEDPERLWVGRRDQSLLLRRDPDTLSPDAARLSNVPAGHAQGYQDAFDAFVADAYAAVAGEQPAGLPTFADGLRAAQITDAVLESARDGRWVEVAS